MLKEKAFFTEGEVAAFRLVSGDEICGEVVQVYEDTVDIKKPCTLAIGNDGNVGLTPAAMLADPEKPVTYFRNQIIAIMVVRPDAEKAYLQFASGIQLATADQAQNIVTK
jgi:hypothetical protein